MKLKQESKSNFKPNTNAPHAESNEPAYKRETKLQKNKK
jgi:hypothetical protein